MYLFDNGSLDDLDTVVMRRQSEFFSELLMQLELDHVQIQNRILLQKLYFLADELGIGRVIRAKNQIKKEEYDYSLVMVSEAVNEDKHDEVPHTVDVHVRRLPISVIDDDLDWKKNSNCRGIDPELFFTERGESTREPKAVCRACQVRIDCLKYAIVNGEKFGIWGGQSERERRKIRKYYSVHGELPEEKVS